MFFGEPVPMFERAVEITRKADIFIVIGSSLAVYPAASLLGYTRPEVPIYVVDPGTPDISLVRNPITHIRQRSAEGTPLLVDKLLQE